MSDKNILFDNFSATDLKELLTDIEYKSPADMGTIVPYNKFQKGGGCQYSDYSYPDDFRYDSEYVSTHNSINNTLRALLYDKTMKPLTYKQQAGAGYSTESSLNNIKLNFTDVPKSVKLSDIDFDSPLLHNYLNSQEGGGVVSYLKYYFGLRKRKIAFKSFIPRFEKVRTDLEKLVKTFETDSEVYKKRADRNAELVHDYYVAQKYGVILTILKDYEADELEDFKLKKAENHEEEANKSTWFYKYRIQSSSQINADLSVIDKYIKFNDIRIKEFKNNLEGLKKIMHKDLKKESKLFGLFKGANYFDKLKKILEKHFNDMESLLNKRNEFTKDMEEARNAMVLYADLSKSDEAELLPERKKMLVLYEKNKEYYENLLKYTPEKIQPLFEVLEKKSVLFARIANYKKQYFGFNIETLVSEFEKWKKDMIEGYKLLKKINAKSNELEKAIGKAADDIAYNINSLKVIQSKEIQDMINDFVGVSKNLNLCESMQSAITSTSASVLNNIGKMEPLNNIMKDMFNIKLAQSMVQHKMQYVYNELNESYSEAALSDTIIRRVARYRTGGALMLAPKPNFYNLIKKTKTTHANKYKKKTNKILTIGGKRNKKYNYSALKGGATCQKNPPIKLIDTLITYPTNFTYRNDLGVLTNIKLETTSGSYESKKDFIDTTNTEALTGTHKTVIFHPHPTNTIEINIDTKHNNNVDITFNLITPALNIVHSGTGAQHTQFRHNMFLDTIPNGFRLPKWDDTNFKGHIDTINTDLKAITDKYCVLFDHDDDKIYIIKNNILEETIDVKTQVMKPEFKKIGSTELYYYNPIFKKRTQRGIDPIKNAMRCLFYSIELKTHDTTDVSKPHKSKLVTFLPLFVESKHHNTANDLIKYNDYYLVNPFSTTYELYLTVAKKEEIDKRKHDKNMFYFKEGDNNRIALEYYLYNDANYDKILNTSKVAIGNDIKANTYYLFTYNVNYLEYEYHDDLKNNYIYFNPGYPGLINGYTTNKTYGIYTNSASALDTNFNAVTMNDEASKDKGAEVYNKVEGVPPHHAILDIGTHINSDKSNNSIKNIINYTTMQSMFFNNILFYLSGAINTSSTIANHDKILKYFHTNLPSGTDDRYNTIEYSYVAERKFINNYYINSDYDLNLFINIVNDSSILDNELKTKYDNTDSIIQISNCIPNFLDSSVGYTDVVYEINHVGTSTIFIKHPRGAGMSGTPLGTPGVPATGTTAAATGTASTTPTLNVEQTATYTHIMNQLAETQVLTRINNIQNTTNMFTTGNTNNIFGVHMSIFNKCMNHFNNNLKRELEFVSIPRKVKTPKDKLKGFTYITDKLEVKISDDKNKPATPEGEGLENLIRENRALIDDVGDVINLTPGKLINDRNMQELMNNILQWTATQGSGPQKYYSYLYNPRFDKFFINKDNVDNFINEMIHKYSRDPARDIKVGKFFHFLPTFMTINLNKFNDVMESIRPYIKLYTESLKPKDKAGKTGTQATQGTQGTARVPVVQTPQQP